MSRLDTDKAIRFYISLRDKKKLIEERHKSELEEINSDMRALEALLQDELNESKQTKLNTELGTAYVSVKTSTAVKDWDAFLGYVKEHDAWGLLTRQANKTAVLDDYKGVVPGVEVSRFNKLTVRRNSK